MRKIDLKAETKFENRKADGEDILKAQVNFIEPLYYPLLITNIKKCNLLRIE